MDAKEFSELLTRSIFTLIKEDKFGISIYHSQNDLTYEKFIESLRTSNDTNDDGVPMSLVESYFLLGKNKITTTDNKIINLEESIGGGFDDGSYVQRVFSLTNGDTKEYFSCEGYYSSWDGIDWEGSHFVKVKPREKTIIEYVPEL